MCIFIEIAKTEYFATYLISSKCFIFYWYRKVEKFSFWLFFILSPEKDTSISFHWFRNDISFPISYLRRFRHFLLPFPNFGKRSKNSTIHCTELNCFSVNEGSSWRLAMWSQKLQTRGYNQLLLFRDVVKQLELSFIHSRFCCTLKIKMEFKPLNVWKLFFKHPWNTFWLMKVLSSWQLLQRNFCLTIISLQTFVYYVSSCTV